MAQESILRLRCASCGVQACREEPGSLPYPKFCPMVTRAELLEEIMQAYVKEGEDRELALAAARTEAAGTSVARGSRALADERHVKDLIVLNDPAGNRLEIFHGAETASDPFKPGRNISGFRTGALGMGHVVMHFER